jgi:type I restriction enzyme S subunit
MCDVTIGGTPSRSNPSYWGTGHTWVSIADLNGEIVTASKEQITDLGVKNSNVKEIEPGTVLMSFKLTIGKVGIAGKKLYTNEAIAALPIKSTWKTNLEKHFLFHALQTVPLGSQADLAVKGKMLNKQKLARILLPIPFPDDPPKSSSIQRRIVSRIEALLAEVKRSRPLLAHIRRDADVVLRSALAEIIQKLDRRSPESPTLHTLISDGRLIITGGGTPSTANKQYWNGTIPWVSPKDMKSWYIDETQDHISPRALEETAVRLVPKGAVLIVVRGMILAHTFPVSVTAKEVTINQDMKALSPADDLLPEYLAYILRARASSILREVEIAAHGTRRLKTDTLMQVIVPDIPKDSQQRIVAYFRVSKSAFVR